MEKEKKIFCIIASNGLSLVNFRGTFVKELVKRNYRVICVSIEPAEKMDECIGNLGAEYRQVAGDRTGIGVCGGLKMIFDYIRLFRSLKPDYCFLYMSKPIAFGGIAAVLCRVKHINVLVNGLENAYYRTGVKDALVRLVMSSFYRYVARHADHVFFQNSDDRKYFVSHKILVRDNSTVVGGSGVDMAHFAREPLPEEPVVLMTARLLWSKGIREFLEAVGIVKHKHPGLKVMLVGGLDHNDEALTREELEQFVREYDIEYCGFADDVRPYLKRCSIYVLPSYHEGLPRSVLEAMSVGRPILTTDVPGCRETVRDGENGFLVPAGNSRDLADKLGVLVENGELRKQMAEKSHAFCREKFEVHGVNEILIRKIQEGKALCS